MKTETITDTTTENRLIAEFMGFTTRPGYPNEYYNKDEIYQGTPENFGYHTSWNWLMPVVVRISEVGAGGVTYDIQNNLIYADIEKVYQAIVEFIQWYNNRLIISK